MLWTIGFYICGCCISGRGYLRLPPATEEMILLAVLGEKFRDSAIGKHVETGLMRWVRMAVPYCLSHNCFSTS